MSGFKFKRVDFTVGSSEFPEGDTDELRLVRSKSIVKRVAEALVAMNNGWILDTAKNATSTDYTYVPARSGSLTFPALFLYNTTSHCRLFISYFPSLWEKHTIKPPNGTPTSSGVTDLFGYGWGCRHSGIVASIIPGGSSNTFGSVWNSSFLPADATRLMGTAVYYDLVYEYQGYSSANAFNPTIGYIYSWGVWATDSCVMFSANRNSANPPSLYTPMAAIGKVFGTLAHSNDTAVNANYGVILFRVGETSTDVECTSSRRRYYYDYSFGLNQTLYIPGANPATSDYYSVSSASIARADGTWYNSNSDDYHEATWYTPDWPQLSGYAFNSMNTGKGRWVPLAVVALTKGNSLDGIVPGDGFKGYLDTDLFRCARGTYGQIFDGAFICANDDFNLLLGWDTSNTDQIAI